MCSLPDAAAHVVNYIKLLLVALCFRIVHFGVVSADAILADCVLILFVRAGCLPMWHLLFVMVVTGWAECVRSFEAPDAVSHVGYWHFYFVGISAWLGGWVLMGSWMCVVLNAPAFVMYMYVYNVCVYVYVYVYVL